jgi:basic membrane lipoprotein Med (substrate-binding protein (PBP1-ABC) superfamily)
VKHTSRWTILVTLVVSCLVILTGTAIAQTKLIIGQVNITPNGDHAWTDAHNQGVRDTMSSQSDDGQVKCLVDGEWVNADPSNLTAHVCQVNTDQVEIKQIINDTGVYDYAGFEGIALDLMSQGATLILGTAENYCEAAQDLAEANPNILYAAINCEVREDLPNFVSYFGPNGYGWYLGGMLAALYIQENNLNHEACAVLAYADNSQVVNTREGFRSGFLSILPDGVIDEFYVNAWSDPPTERARAEACPSTASVIFSHLDGITVAQYVLTERPETTVVMCYDSDCGQTFMESNDPDLQAQAYRVLGSVVWRWEPIYSQLISAALSGDFSSLQPLYYPSLDSGVVNLVTHSTLVSDAAWTRVQEAKSQIIVGNLEPFPGLTTDEVRFLSPDYHAQPSQ